MIAALAVSLALSAEAAVAPLPQAYAHNDYRQARPLLDALDRAVREAHGNARMIRFWGIPDREETWALLRDAGVDLINTDKLERLKNFLRVPPGASPRADRTAP